jgi:nucleoside-triphosphatase THEP1
MEGRGGGFIKNVLLTGKPGAGKTTALIAVVKMLGGSAGSFYTGEIREKGERTGFSIVTLSGERRVMASKAFKSACRVGKYGVDVEAIDATAVAAIEDALRHNDIIVIDEIGKMELFSKKFREAVTKALDSEKPVAGVIMENHNEFAGRVKEREDVMLIEVTASNRDRVPVLLKERIEKLKKVTLMAPIFPGQRPARGGF